MGVENRVAAEDQNGSGGGRYGDRRGHDPDFSGPIRDRSCTDVLCLLLFIVFLVFWFVVAIISFVKGDPDRLINPSNSRGEICGRGDYK